MMVRGQVMDTQVSSRNACFCSIFLIKLGPGCCSVLSSVLNNNLSSGIRARGIVGFLSQPIIKQVRICNTFQIPYLV